MNQDDAVNPNEIESQLSTMFDGELPAAECELLSRRIDRDENLRGRWSRYALIGAAMRFEPVATARSNFAARVSTALDLAEGRAPAARTAGAGRRRQLLWQSALAATLVGVVAGLSITLLRNNVTLGTAANARQALSAQVGASAPPALPQRPVALASATGPTALAAPAQLAVFGQAASREPWSYVTPGSDASARTALRTELVDYIVAHSEYSTPLMRPDLLSALISGEDGSDNASPATSAAGSSLGAGAGEIDATSAASRSSR